MCSGSKTGSGYSFSVFCNKIVSGVDTGSGGNSTMFLGQAGRHDAVFYELGNYQSDEHSDPHFCASAGGADSSGIDRDSDGILAKKNMLDVSNQTGITGGYDDRCFDWSSIFPTTRTEQCYLGEYSDENIDSVDIRDVLSLLSGWIENSNQISASQSGDLGQDSKDDFVHGPTPSDCCIVIGFIIFLVVLVRKYGGTKHSRPKPVVRIPGHALAARTAASKSCWKGRRQSWAVARFRKAFRKWRWDSVSVRHQRSNMILGGIFFGFLIFQSVAEGSVTAAHEGSMLVNTDQYPNLDINQLAQLDVDPVLIQFIGNVVTELKEVKTELHAVQAELHEVKHDNGAVGAEMAWVQNRTQVLEMENKAVRAELAQVTRDKNALENKTHVVQVELSMEKKRNAMLRVEVTETRSLLYQFSDKTNTRLDQCEAKSYPFIQEMEHRRLQQAEQCHGSGMQTMLAACCPGGGGSGGHRRELQSGHGCATTFPDTCSVACSAIFNEFYEDCHESMIASMPAAEQTEFDSFYGACTEAAQQAAVALEGASPAMIFHVVVVDQEAEQQAAMANGGGGSGSDSSHFGPVNLPPTPAPPSDAGGAVAAQEFRRVCTTVNLPTCVPECNAVTYGFLLSIEIDGRGTVMTCNKMGILFSWQGQASLGGYIGSDASAFFSSVVSGAAGTYLAMLAGDAGINADLSIERGQLVFIKGAEDVVPAWGSGGFVLTDGASLSLKRLHISGHIVAAEGAALMLDNVMVEAGGCVGAHSPSQVTLIDTISPEECLVNVKYDDNDTAAFLAALGSGLPGTYVLRVVAAAAPYTISTVSVGPQQDVRLIATAPNSSLSVSGAVTVVSGASFAVSGALSELDFLGPVSAGAGASFAVSLAASESVTFQSPVAMGADGSLSIGGSIVRLAFPAGLRTAEGGMASIRSSSVGSIAVAMGTTWYAVDPSSNEGSVMFSGVGLLSTDGETLIGTVDGTLPGALSVELNGLQPGGNGVPQSGSVLLGDDGAIYIPPELSAAVGQVFTDERIDDFLTTVSRGAPGMYGMQLSGTAHAFTIGDVHVSGGQDVRIFSSGTSLSVTFIDQVAVAPGGSMFVRGSFSTIDFSSSIDVQDDASMVISTNDGAEASALSESALTFHGAISVGERSSLSIRAAAGSVSFGSRISAPDAATVVLSLTAEMVTFEGSVETGAGSSLRIDGTIGILSFLVGLRTGGTTAIQSASPSSIAVAMGTTWFALDPSSNRGTVTFVNVGLLDTDGVTLIGAVRGTLPGGMHVELNGLQPGGDGISAQIGDVELSADGEITLPTKLAGAIGQAFTVVSGPCTVAQAGRCVGRWWLLAERRLRNPRGCGAERRARCVPSLRHGCRSSRWSIRLSHHARWEPTWCSVRWWLPSRRGPCTWSDHTLALKRP
eukprot:SAG22_NODE_166_length_16765_cov_30.782791_16_plen_1401_part_00